MTGIISGDTLLIGGGFSWLLCIVIKMCHEKETNVKGFQRRLVLLRAAMTSEFVASAVPKTKAKSNIAEVIAAL
jgi:hypothetical protein